LAAAIDSIPADVGEAVCTGTGCEDDPPPPHPESGPAKAALLKVRTAAAKRNRDMVVTQPNKAWASGHARGGPVGMRAQAGAFRAF
jgi:hypothetical protein